jgi:hypothetical protein
MITFIIKELVLFLMCRLEDFEEVLVNTMHTSPFGAIFVVVCLKFVLIEASL